MENEIICKISKSDLLEIAAVSALNLMYFYGHLSCSINSILLEIVRVIAIVLLDGQNF